MPLEIEKTPIDKLGEPRDKRTKKSKVCSLNFQLAIVNFDTNSQTDLFLRSVCTKPGGGYVVLSCAGRQVEICLEGAPVGRGGLESAAGLVSGSQPTPRQTKPLLSVSLPYPTSLSHTNIFPSPLSDFLDRFLNIDTFLLVRGNQPKTKFHRF